MQIIMDEGKIIKEGKYNLKKLYASLDDFLVSKLGFEKISDNFYCGRGTRNDYAHFGVAMTTLGKKQWFMENVDTWLYFNSDDSNDPDDFDVEDFKEFCQQRYQMTA
jgi:virulence-associated protein VapD